MFTIALRGGGHPPPLPFDAAWPVFRTRAEAEAWLAVYRADLQTDFAEWPALEFVVVEVSR